MDALFVGLLPYRMIDTVTAAGGGGGVCLFLHDDCGRL